MMPWAILMRREIHALAMTLLAPGEDPTRLGAFTFPPFRTLIFMQRTALFAALVLASGLALAQNVARRQQQAHPKAREDAWVKELTKQGQKDTPELRKMVKERLDPERGAAAGSNQARHPGAGRRQVHARHPAPEHADPGPAAR